MADLRFDDRVAIVTGAGRGLGREHALLLAERGARVVVNNAGFVDDALFDDMTAERFEPLIDVHLKGAFFVTRPAWKAMREQGYGRIVNTTSAAGILGSPRMSNYGSAKTGLIGFTRVLAAEGAELGITVNAVAPIANTRMLERSMASVAELAGADALASAQELMRPFFDKVDPALVSPVVAFLGHADCPVTGEMYTVGAGQVSRFFIGRTRGYHNPALTLEDVAANLDAIRNESGYTVPAGPADEMAELFAAIMPG